VRGNTPMFCVDIGALKTISMAIWMSASAKIGNARRKRSHPGPKCSSKTDPPPSISFPKTRGRGRDGPAGRPPHRSVRAELPHTALTLGVWRRSERWDTDAESWVSESSDRRASRNAPTAAASVGYAAAKRTTRRERLACETNQERRCCQGWRGSCNNPAPLPATIGPAAGSADGAAVATSASPDAAWPAAACSSSWQSACCHLALQTRPRSCA
jgi:hypothetical protein